MALTNIVTNMDLDVYDHNLTPTTIKSIAMDDNTRYVAAAVLWERNPYDIGQSAGVILTVLRPDNTGVQVIGSTYSYDADGTTMYGAYAELTQLAIAIKGTCRAQFKITDGDQILRTEIFYINNGQALDADISTWAGTVDGHNLDEMASSIETLTTQVGTNTDAISQLNTDLTSLDGRVEALEQGGGSSRYLPADFIEALQAILSEAIYGEDQSDAIDDLSDFSDNTHYYNVTLTMTHCASSNAATSVVGGGSYTTTITAAEGYVLTSVTCTMGGTAQTVTNGVISIAEVTGDIVITALADVYEEGLLYKLSETTTFDGTNVIDTGIALEGNYNSDNTIEFTIACTTTCTDTGDKYAFSEYSTGQSGTGLYVDLSGKARVYAKWFTQSKNTTFAWVNADVLRIVYRKKSGEYPTVSFTKNGDTANGQSLTFTTTADNAVISSSDHIIIGQSPSGAGKLKGTMSDFRVYDRAYSDAELASYLGGE